MENFNELNLPESLQQALVKMEFNTPTPIQAQAIPIALAGQDILGSAQTGTGKTGAFGIPLVAHLINNPGSAALIMTPTRELAVQVNQMLKKLLSTNTYIKTALLIGGEVMFRQFAQLEDKPRIIIGTPGRINDHLARKSLKLSNVDFLVLDETDRMLDMGFGIQIDKILTYMTGKRQTLLFSATMPSHIVRLAEKYMHDAARIAVGSTTAPIANIKQEIIRVAQAQKYETLTQQLDARTGSIIVFVRTKHGCDRLAAKLDRENHSADAIHGDLRQNKRDKVIRMFREKKTRILIATDVAARGLDIPHIEHVINYDLPQCPEDYIHRIGRTARAGAQGEALCLVSPDEGGKWAAIERLMNGGQGSSEEQGRGGHRSKGKSGYGRKNEGGFGARREGGFGKREGGGFKQDRNRKPHRKGQSWQEAHDVRKAGEAAAAEMNAGVEQKFERKFEKRDDKASFRSNDRNDRPSKPWQKREGGGDRPYQKRDRAEGGESRPYQKREGSSDRPYQKREGSSDRPYQKRERTEGASDKPWQKKREGGFEKKPWQKREGSSDRPYQKREGASSDRPYQKRDRAEGGDKPWQKKREGGNDRPFVKRDRPEGGSDRPYVKREGGFEKKPWQKREGSSDRPYQKREGASSDRPYQKREGSSDRPYQKREGGSDKPWQKRERSDRNGEQRPQRSDRPFQKREGSSDRPFQKRDGDKPRFPQGRKLSGNSISGNRSRFDADKPFRRKPDAA